ncbi:MAG: inositol monophosphatase [Patescibacteria group bacterium]
MNSKEPDYQKILDFMTVSGERLVKRAGNIADIGITKKDLTEEDLLIERGLKEIIVTFGNDHCVYAEEENDMFKKSKHIWVIDPISGTHTFINGQKHYGIVVAHIVDSKTVFSAVYDPSEKEMFTAYEGRGAFLNSEKINVGTNQNKLIFLQSQAWKGGEKITKVEELIRNFEVIRQNFSFAINYCWVACGRVDGIISFTKDSFPEFAGGFIIQEAGGIFTNFNNQEINHEDRMFIGGNPKIHEQLFNLLK